MTTMHSFDYKGYTVTTYGNRPDTSVVIDNQSHNFKSLHAAKVVITARIKNRTVNGAKCNVKVP